MPEDVTHLLPGESGEQQPQPEQPAEQMAEPAEEYVPFKYRGEDRQIAASTLDKLADEVGVNRDVALLWLQGGKDFGQHMAEVKQRERELARREAELVSYEERMQTQLRQQPQPQPQQAVPAEDDPIALIRAIYSAQQMMAKEIQQEREQFKTVLQQERMEQEQRVFKEAYSQWADSKKSSGFKNVPTQEELIQEAYDMGMGYARHLTPNQVYEKAFRSLRFEDAGAAAQQQTLEKLRNPKAQVVVPSGGGAAQQKQPAAQPGTLESLGEMKWGEMIQNLPERRSY